MVEIDLTKDEYIAAMRVHSARTYAWLAVGYVIFIVIMVYFNREEGFPWGYPAIMVAAFGFSFVMGGVRLRRGYREWKRISRTIKFGWSSVALTTESDVGALTFSWDKVLKVRESGKYLLIYLASNILHIIPKTALTTPEYEEFIGFIRQAGVKLVGVFG